MYEGQPKVCYGGLALNDRQFLVATYLSDLTAPDEQPYMTGQFAFDVERGWGPAVWYEEEFITAYTLADVPIALARDGRIFDANTGELRDYPDPQVTTHFGAIAANGDRLFLAGDNGRFWMGGSGSMAPVSNPFFRALPGPDAPLAAQIEWGQAMQPTFSALLTASGGAVVGGARGFLARDKGQGFVQIDLPVTSHVTGLIEGHDGHIYLCGHSPSAFVARLAPDDSIQILYQENGGPAIRAPQVHEGELYLAAPGANGGVFILNRGQLRAATFSDTAGNGAAWHLDKRGIALWTVFERALVRTINDQSDVWKLPTAL
jgi:hypothetical protein